MPIDLLLFDLDDTLFRTEDLEGFRGREFLGRQPAEYVYRLTPKFLLRNDRICYTAERLHGLRRRFPNAKFGVFTRSPRHYADVLLAAAYRDFSWDVVVAFEDVTRTKPSGDGIRLAMQIAGVSLPQNVWMVGDGKVDIQSAYDAGCWCVLDTTTWPARRRNENWWALERMPDSIISDPSELEEVLKRPHEFIPVAEYLQVMNGDARPGVALRFDKVNCFHALEDAPFVPIHFLGRHFSKEAQRRVNWHPVTNDIHRMKEMLEVPGYWISAIRSFLQHVIIERNSALSFGFGSLVITVVPAKPGRVPRLEAMLEQLSRSHADVPISRGRFEFLPGLMRYLPGVQSQHGGEGLNKRQRFENVRDHLQVIPNSGYAGKHVVVIDDVGTTGASLMYAEKYLRRAGASQVTCLALTKAINTL